MWILCEHNVPKKYVAAFQRAAGLEVTTVEDGLRHVAPMSHRHH